MTYSLKANAMNSVTDPLLSALRGLLLLAGGCAWLSSPVLASRSDTPAGEGAPGAPMRVDRGEGKLPLFIPRDEVLEFDVLLDIAVVGETKVGDFRLSAGVKDIGGGLPMPGRPANASKQSGWIKSKAWGRYFGYSLDHEIEMRTMPQDWPRVIYSDHQSGSENRQRELKYGLLEGEPMAWYRSDHHCSGCERHEHFVEGGWFSKDKHCKKCQRMEHRVWRDPKTLEIPSDSLDMLSAIYLARELIRLGRSEIDFSLIDKDNVWYVTMRRGLARTRTTPGGSFRCREVKFLPKPAKDKGEKSRFEGLFGIHGTISIWLHEKTGVPVEIGGMVPLGPIDIDVRLGLTRWRGTPDEFQPQG